MKLAQSTWLAAGAWLLIGAAGSLSWAQPPQGGPPKGGPPMAEPPPADARFRDPTQPSPEMRQAIEAAQAVPGTGPAAAPPALPQIKLKARLLGASAPPVAMLDVNGRLFTAHEGEETTIVNPGGGTSTLIVRELSATAVQVEVLPLKKTLILQ